MSTLFQQRVEREKRVGWFYSTAVNSVLFYYCFFAFLFFLSLFELAQADNATLLMGFIPLSLVCGVLWSKTPRSLGRIIVERTNPILKGTRKPLEGSYIKTFSGVFCIFLSVLTFTLGFMLTDVSFYSLLSYEGIAGAQRIFVSIFTPEWSILNVVLKAMVETIFIALLATAIAIPIAFVVSFFAAKNLMKGSAFTLLMYNALRFVFNFSRSIEPLIWAIIFSVWVGIGPFAGMLALMIHSIASLIKLYSEQIESIDYGPVEAIKATGANMIQVVWYAIVPQVVLPFLSYTVYRWDINIRMATIIGLVGGGGVGTLLMQYQGLAKWHEVGTIVVVIAVVVWFMDFLSAKLREAIY